MKNKNSLLKNCFSKETLEGKADKDEMIISERNKVSYVGMTIFTAMLFVFGILSDILEIGGISNYITMIIGIVNYGMLIAYCKKGIVNHVAALSAFIWSIFTLPLSIVNLFLDKIVEGKIYVIAQPIAIVFIVILLYVISNLIYKNALDED